MVNCKWLKSRQDSAKEKMRKEEQNIQAADEQIEHLRKTYKALKNIFEGKAPSPRQSNILKELESEHSVPIPSMRTDRSLWSPRIRRIDNMIEAMDNYTEQLYGNQVPWPAFMRVLPPAFIIITTLICLIRPDFTSAILAAMIFLYHTSDNTPAKRLKQTSYLLFISIIFDFLWLLINFGDWIP